MSTVLQAVGMFVATNIDDLVVLTVFFGRARGDRAAVVQVVAGQYLGFVAILVVSVLGALGVQLLPGNAIAYFGLLPLLLGVRAAWSAWTDRRRAPDGDENDAVGTAGVGVLTVAAVTFANGGDNIGLYVPVFAVAGLSGIPTYAAIFLILVALWCALSRRISQYPAVARALARWENIVLPVVFIGIGLTILVKGGAFGL